MTNTLPILPLLSGGFVLIQSKWKSLSRLIGVIASSQNTKNGTRNFAAPPSGASLGSQLILMRVNTERCAIILISHSWHHVFYRHFYLFSFSHNCIHSLSAYCTFYLCVIFENFFSPDKYHLKEVKGVSHFLIRERNKRVCFVTWCLFRLQSLGIGCILYLLYNII